MEYKLKIKDVFRKLAGTYLGVSPLYQYQSGMFGEVKVTITKRTLKFWLLIGDGSILRKEFRVGDFGIMQDGEKKLLLSESNLDPTIFLEKAVGFRLKDKTGYPEFLFVEKTKENGELVFVLAIDGLSEIFGVARLFDSHKKERHENVIKELEKMTKKPVLCLPETLKLIN